MVALDDYDCEFESRVDSVRNAFQEGWIRWLRQAGPASRIAAFYHDCMFDLDRMRRDGLRSLPTLYRSGDAQPDQRED